MNDKLYECDELIVEGGREGESEGRQVGRQEGRKGKTCGGPDTSIADCWGIQ